MEKDNAGRVGEPGELLPLTPAVLNILLALADKERHGYGIMREVEERTEGQTRLGPGTLYGSIKRMLADGLIEESDERPDPAMDDQRRRYYRITDFGRRVAAVEAERLARARRDGARQETAWRPWVFRPRGCLMSRSERVYRAAAPGVSEGVQAGIRLADEAGVRRSVQGSARTRWEEWHRAVVDADNPRPGKDGGGAEGQAPHGPWGGNHVRSQAGRRWNLYLFSRPCTS